MHTTNSAFTGSIQLQHQQLWDRRPFKGPQTTKIIFTRLKKKQAVKGQTNHATVTTVAVGRIAIAMPPNNGHNSRDTKDTQTGMLKMPISNTRFSFDAPTPRKLHKYPHKPYCQKLDFPLNIFAADSVGIFISFHATVFENRSLRRYTYTGAKTELVKYPFKVIQSHTFWDQWKADDGLRIAIQ